MVSQLKELQDENRRLKKMYADSQLSAELLKEALAKNGEAISATRDGPTGGGRATNQHPSCLRNVRHQLNLLPLPGQASR